MKLYEIKKDSKIYEDVDDGSLYIKFKHLEGLYTLCETEKGNIIYINLNAALTPFRDGYKFLD